MPRYAEPMARLIDELKKLPGVGTKSAQRYAFHDEKATQLQWLRGRGTVEPL